MLNDDRDKDLQRNQLIAIVLMTLLVVAWSYFFLPSPQPQTQQTPAAVVSSPAGQPPAADSPTAVSEISAKVETIAPGSPMAWLPPPASPAADPVDDEVRLATDGLELVFTRVGARLKQARVVLGKNGVDSAQLVPEEGDLPDADAVYPLGLQFSNQFWGNEADRRRWDAKVSEDGQEAVFTLEVPEHARVTKSFRMVPASNVLTTRVAFENLSPEMIVLGLDTREPALSLTWGPQVSSQDLTIGLTQQFVSQKAGKESFLSVTALKPPKDGAAYSERIPGAQWVALCSSYFAVGVKPEFEAADGWIVGAPQRFAMGVGAPRTEVGPGQRADWSYQVYIGSTARQSLAAAWPGFGGVQRFFTMFDFMDGFAKFLLAVLNWFHDHVYANYGLAIIFLTVLVRVAVFPLTWKSMISMKRMGQLAPELEKIKQEVGENDPQELQRRTMELYRNSGVNPLGGCLPLFLQMPVFFALYRMLWSAFELRRAPFLWITDLSEQDRLFALPFHIPIPFTTQTLDYVNLLPILGAVAMFLSQKLMPVSGPAQNPQQKMMMNIMPVIFSVFMYNLASGLNLYIFVSTVLGIAQSMVIQRVKIDLTPKTTTKKPAARRRHFYTAAQAKKREIAHEIRREKEKRPRS